MANFCPECVRKIFGVKKKDSDYVFSKELCFCEECCRWKRVVIYEKDTIDYHPNLWIFKLFDK